jgi:hypothetical protein
LEWISEERFISDAKRKFALQLFNRHTPVADFQIFAKRSISGCVDDQVWKMLIKKAVNLKVLKYPSVTINHLEKSNLLGNIFVFKKLQYFRAEEFACSGGELADIAQNLPELR